jgi:prepilin-type N-terminal cleavage/methylation domain-containing protein
MRARSHSGFTLIEPSHEVAKSARTRGSSAAFTLIELSIVLVIIGLLVGGVLVGRDLIKAAEIRAQISQIDQIKAAAYTFKTMYDCLPGDCDKAVTLGLGSGGGPGANGNGDGAVNKADISFELSLSTNWIGSQAYESLNFWYHLVEAKLISGAYPGYTGQPEFTTTGVWNVTMPAAKLGGIVIPTRFAVNGANNRTGGNGFWVGTVAGVYLSPMDMMPPATAYAIDSKVDDGLPFTGNIGCAAFVGRQAQAAGGGDNCFYIAYPDILCSEWGAVNSYAITLTSGACALVFLSQY